ncbi:MAG: protein kinase [Chloroflexi bacterium]|nr:protein kinase [Chloroflexota bacterium]
MDAPALLIASRYAIQDLQADLLGRGSMGNVYRGIDTETAEPVAIKVLQPEVVAGRPQMVDRFVREGESLRQLNHPNIVKMLAAVEEDGRYYLIMEYVPGGSLQDLLDRQAPLPLRRVLQISLELADALARAHHLGIIHRDLKPANVLLAADGTPRLSDFGIAYVAGRPRLTDVDTVVGTLGYISPEAYEGEPLDARADIWAFGVLIYEMLTGLSPFTGDNLADTLAAILSQPPPDLDERRPDAPAELVALVHGMLARDREQRIASARQVGATLEMLWQTATGEYQAGTLPAVARPVRPSLVSPPAPARQDSQAILLAKVKRFWVEGVLERATPPGAPPTATLLDLALRPDDQAIDHPWQQVMGTALYERPVPAAGETVGRLFAESDHALLILGAPGAGKTTTLIRLARELITVAERDPSRPVPVILNLASWVERRLAIADWVVEDLTAKYQIPRKFGRDWLENGCLILLLDGLDEMPGRYQADCIRAINHFRQQHGLVGLAVCARLKDYKANGEQLKLGGAVVIEPLTPQQVDRYLVGAGLPYAGLRTAVQRDEAWQELAQSPLMLSVMCLAYGEGEGDPAVTLAGPVETGGRQREILFNAYIERMFQRRPAGRHYSPGQTQALLAWLARRMTEHNQSVFLIEQMQPSWLPSRGWQWLYLLLSRLSAGFFVGVFLWLFRLRPEMIAVGLGLGLLLGLYHGLQYERHRGLAAAGQADRPLWYESLFIGALAAGLTTALFFFLFPGEGAAGAAAAGSSNALYWGLITGIAFGVNTHVVFGRSFRTDVRIVEALRWSWPGALKGGGAGLALGLVLGLLAGQAFGFSLQMRWSLTLELALVLALFAGLQGGRLETRSGPNQGIRLSLRNGLLAAVLFGVLDGLLLTYTSGVDWGLRRLVQFGLAAGLNYGGFNLLSHLLLRWLLWLSSGVPWRLARFLNHAVGLVFLYRVGGGYIFIHRLLQEHFAALSK